MKKETVMVLEWECMECGYIEEGSRPPARCPECGAPRHRFQRLDILDEEEEDEALDLLDDYDLEEDEEDEDLWDEDEDEDFFDDEDEDF
jgi:NMD protein affecting ribosome stability and mRNA decay